MEPGRSEPEMRAVYLSQAHISSVDNDHRPLVFQPNPHNMVYAADCEKKQLTLKMERALENESQNFSPLVGKKCATETDCYLSCCMIRLPLRGRSTSYLAYRQMRAEEKKRGRESEIERTRVRAIRCSTLYEYVRTRQTELFAIIEKSHAKHGHKTKNKCP